MKMNQHIVKAVRPSSSGGLLSEHCSGILEHIRKAKLLAVALGVIVVLATGCSSTGTGFNARLISPVPTNQQASNAEDDSWYQPSRSPGFDPDLFGG